MVLFSQPFHYGTREVNKIQDTDLYKATHRRLISKSAFMQFLAIFTFLHIWEDEGRGYLKMQGP